MDEKGARITYSIREEVVVLIRIKEILLNSKAIGLSLGTNIHYSVPNSALDLAFSSMFSSMFSFMFSS
jgi:hypothetical protein